MTKTAKHTVEFFGGPRDGEVYSEPLRGKYLKVFGSLGILHTYVVRYRIADGEPVGLYSIDLYGEGNV